MSDKSLEEIMVADVAYHKVVILKASASSESAQGEEGSGQGGSGSFDHRSRRFARPLHCDHPPPRYETSPGSRGLAGCEVLDLAFAR